MPFWEAVRTFFEAVIGIFAIVNPIGNLPVFVGLIEDLPPEDRRRVMRVAGVTSLILICAMAVLGQFLLDRVFHITMDEFMFGGGLILIVVGIRGIMSRPEQGHGSHIDDPKLRSVESVQIAVSPIASPLLVGPGSIVTVMLVVTRHDVLYALAACLAAFVFVILILNYAEVAYRLMGRIGALAVGRIMQTFIVAMGAHFVFSAVKVVFPALTK